MNAQELPEAVLRQPLVQTAKETGLSVPVLVAERGRRGIVISRGRKPIEKAPKEPKSRFIPLAERFNEWLGLNWTETSSKIAKQMKTSRAYSSYVRGLLEKGGLIPVYPRQRGVGNKARNARKELLGEFLTENKDIIAYYRLSPMQIIRFLKLKKAVFLIREVGPKHKTKGVMPWHLVNWKLPNNILAEIWKIPVSSVANTRCRMDQGASKWFTGFGFLPDDAAFQNAKMEELEKVAAWNGCPHLLRNRWLEKYAQRWSEIR